MTTLLPRLLGALASGLVVWLAQVLERKLGLTLSPEEREAMTGAFVAFGLTVYSLAHREISKRVNPDDRAAQ